MNHTVDRKMETIPPTPEQSQVRVIHSSRDVPASFKRMVLVYVGLVITVEAVTMLVSSIAGAVFYGILLIALANLSYFTQARIKRSIFQAFMLVPLLRILSLAMPIQKVPSIYQYILTGVPLLIATLMVVRANGMPSLRLNLSGLEWLYQIIIGASGIPLGFIAALVLEPPPSLISNSSIISVFLLWIVFTLFGAVMEEIIFRGLLQKSLFYTFGPASILLTSLLYASMFLGTLSPGYIIFYGLSGLLFSIWVQLSDSIAGVIVAHSLMNIVFLLLVYLFH